MNVLTDSTGTEVQRLTYLSFGETASETHTADNDFYWRRYTGQEQDPETGLYFYHARYYNPALGRFISPDPIVPDPGNPQSLNRYSYVNNNPVNLVDPTGHFSLGGFFKSLLPIVVGVVVGLATGGMGAPAVVAGMAGGAAAGAVNSAVNGGNLGTNVLVGAAFGGFAAGVGGPLAQSLGGGLQGAVGSGAILGAAYGGIGAAAAGKNVLTGMLAGAVSGALLAAAIYSYQTSQQQGSPALYRELQGDYEAATVLARDRYGVDITQNDFIRGTISRYESFTGQDLSGLRVYLGGTVADGYAAATMNENTVVLRSGFFSFSEEQQLLTLGHEFQHVSDIGTIPDFYAQRAQAPYYFEVRAEMTGAAFATHVLGIMGDVMGDVAALVALWYPPFTKTSRGGSDATRTTPRRPRRPVMGDVMGDVGSK